MKKKLSILLLFYVKFAFAQDIHFSQHFVDRMYMNPSLVGNITNADYRISMQRRSQWQSVGAPFSTFSTSFESKNIYKSFNFGVQFLNDKSGDSKLTLNQLNLSVSKSFKLIKVNTLSLGGIVGFGQKTIDYTNLVFEENEDFFYNSFIYPDIGFGIYCETNPNEIMSCHFGASSYHLNNPNNSFNKDENVNLPLKNNLNFGITYKYREKILINSEIIISNQSTQKEILVGISPRIKVSEIFIFPLAYYRVNDAAILGFGLEKDNIQANISYDINTSDLAPASKNRGGFEFSILYFWKKRKKNPLIEIKEQVCPKYL